MTDKDLIKIKNKWVERLAARGKSRAIINQWKINIRFGEAKELVVDGDECYAVCIPDVVTRECDIIVKSTKSNFYKRNPCSMDIIVLHELLHVLLTEFNDKQHTIGQRAETVIDEIAVALYEGWDKNRG